MNYIITLTILIIYVCHYITVLLIFITSTITLKFVIVII